MKNHEYYVYILTNNYNKVLYTGVTNNLKRRVSEHKNKLTKGFTSKYNVDKLVYIEFFNSIQKAIEREKQIKGYSRLKKNELINKFNPEWIELFVDGKIVTPNKNEDMDDACARRTPESLNPTDAY